ncbi:glycoside hydrolase family 55 protein [Arthrobacter sp. ISL-65]|uniref:glycoside hydrolase family 55 protein n=1 Tax=Arthrobacter sp. ISL-65 TaxID=2819112 RepID=UPI001BEBE5D3|nr:hypothetical protein [Arthrobacter sp. ISL-65]
MADFSAVGDGVTDDTAAIQVAIDYVASTRNRGTLLLPPGDFRVTRLVWKRVYSGMVQESPGSARQTPSRGRASGSSTARTRMSSATTSPCPLMAGRTVAPPGSWTWKSSGAQRPLMATA